MYYETGAGSCDVKKLSFDYRKAVYDKGDMDEVFYVDLFIAVLFLSINKSAWKLLPSYTGLSEQSWKNYLHSKDGLKMLWSAQQLIGESNILRGTNGIVQLPTGVGKTKSIELIIRSAFMKQRASIVVIVAPLRALCNEITTDMMKAFGREIKINQFSDVLQEDIVFLMTPVANKLLYVLRRNLVTLSITKMELST